MLKGGRKKYGIPYMGSKEKILPFLQQMIDGEKNKKYFIDPFCGGFAVSSYILQTTDFKVLANDLNEFVIDLYKEMIFNKSQEIKKIWFDWVSRERFFDVRDNPKKYPKWYVGYVLTIWSFGNNQHTYIFGKNIESIKKQAHDYLIENGYDGLREKRISLIKEFKEKSRVEGRFELERLQQLERLEQLQRLERLQQLEQLQQLGHKDWYNFIQSIPKKILEKSFIYCDPPYENTAKYQKNEMDYKKFWDWFRECPYPVYVSSYSAPDDIKPLYSIEKRALFSQRKGNIAKENLYFNGRGNRLKTMLF